jgi:nucleoside phosphorylase
MNRENAMMCIVFPMGMEMHPFLRRVQTNRRWNRGKTTYREVFFEGCHLLVARCGIGPVRAAESVRKLDVPVSAIFCVGTAGALVPELRVGDLLVASETVASMDGAEPLTCAGGLVDALVSAALKDGFSVRTGRLVTSPIAVFAGAERHDLHRTTGGLVVDMESHSIALEAQKLNVPFTTLRVVSDDVLSSRYPDKPNFAELAGDLRQLPRILGQFWYRRKFMKNLRASVDRLHPPLVRLIRNARDLSRHR